MSVQKMLFFRHISVKRLFAFNWKIFKNKNMDKETFIQNEIVALLMRGWKKTDARIEAEERFDYLYSDEDSESE